MTQFRTLPPFGGDQRAVAEVLRGAMDGKTNNTGRITLATGGATTTTINDPRIGYDSIILLEPETVAAATAYPPYGAFQDDTDQSIASTTTAYPMLLGTTDYALGVNVVSGSRITVDYSGLYNIQFSSQFTNTDSQIQDISIWFRKNGTDVTASNSEFSISNRHGGIDGALIAALNFFLPLAKNDYVEIVWRASNVAVSMQHLPAQTSPTRPSTPSVIATIQHVSSNGYTADTFTEPFILSRSQGSAVISHPANSVSGRAYGYVVVG
jgi:hypothetical protein